MSVSKDDVTKRVNGLLSGLLDRETMATHSLTGKPKTPKDPAKPSLDSVIVQAISGECLQYITVVPPDCLISLMNNWSIIISSCHFNT